MTKGILVRTLRLARGTSMALGVAVMLAAVLGATASTRTASSPKSNLWCGSLPPAAGDEWIRVGR